MPCHSNEVLESFVRAIKREHPDRTPVVCCISSPYIC